MKTTEVEKDDREQQGNTSNGGSGNEGTPDNRENRDGQPGQSETDRPNGESPIGDTERPKRDREENKRSILTELRNKANKRNLNPTDADDRDLKSELPGLSGDDKRSNVNNGGHDRIKQGDASGHAGGDRQTGGSNSNANNDNQSTETNLKKKLKIDLPPLVGLTGDGKKKKGLLSPQPDEKTLTKKEGTELKPILVEALMVMFSSMDKGLAMATRNPNAKEVYIWESISIQEADIIAASIIQLAMQVPRVATLTRRVSRDFTKLQLGIILVPRFISSVQHLWTNTFNYGGQ